MAGGLNAQFTVCLECLAERVLTRATRVREGTETDDYLCERGHRFGLDFPRGAPKEPDWPPSQDLVHYCQVTL